MIKPTSIIIVLILCICGYLVLRHTPKTRYQFAKTAGYHTFLQSLVFGSIIFFVSMSAYAAFAVILESSGTNFSLSDLIFNAILKLDISESSRILADICTISVLISSIVPRLLTFMRGQEVNEAKTIEYFSQSPHSPEFTELFFRSVKVGLPILFTLSDRKVYIGYITKIRHEEFNDIEMIPMYSGYRDKETLEIKLVTPYMDVLEDIENESTGNEDLDEEIFSVSIPLREIIHAHLYDFSYQKQFRAIESTYQKGVHYSSHFDSPPINY